MSASYQQMWDSMTDREKIAATRTTMVESANAVFNNASVGEKTDYILAAEVVRESE